MLSRRLIVAMTATLLAGGWLGWRLTLEILPYRIMSETESYLAGLAGGPNVILHARRFGPVPVEIPRANPDIMASTCVYDLRAGSVRIRGQGWTDYWSLSVYSHRSDNIFVVNDADADAVFDITIVRDAAESVALGSRRVVSPTRTGIALVRRLVTDRDQLPQVLANQKGTTCTAGAP